MNNTKRKIAEGVVHKVSKDLREALASSKVREAWNDLTSLARNEWICWITFPKKQERTTSSKHAQSLLKESAGLVVGQVALIVKK